MTSSSSSSSPSRPHVPLPDILYSLLAASRFDFFYFRFFSCTLSCHQLERLESRRELTQLRPRNRTTKPVPYTKREEQDMLVNYCIFSISSDLVYYYYYYYYYCYIPNIPIILILLYFIIISASISLGSWLKYQVRYLILAKAWESSSSLYVEFWRSLRVYSHVMASKKLLF